MGPMSWDSNRDKGEWVRNPWKRRNVKRRLVDEIKEDEPIEELRWDLDSDVVKENGEPHDDG